MTVRLQRYVPINDRRGESFGPRAEGDGSQLIWYVSFDSPEKIGIISNGSQTEGNVFIAQFFKGSGDLIISPNKKRLTRLESAANIGITVTEDYNPAQLDYLIRGIRERGLRHVYISSSENDGRLDGASPNILTFSSQAPPSNLYHTGQRAGIGPIDVRFE